MGTVPLLFRYEGEGEFKPATPYWGRRADLSYVVGEVYRLITFEERSQASHNHYFAALQSGFDNMPDAMRDQFPTVEHMRKKLLVRAGYADERSIVCASKAEAERMAAFIRPVDEYAIVTAREAVVRVFTAQSQSMKAMGAKRFQESKQAVLDQLDDMLGVSRGETSRSAA
ncbi:hypothetical protein [Mesorhizobium sp. BE184]|uniref:hypothetical protein n=1 Tax=Mesorhizobium sp. BE184 TaxID=2817714 RepID=UPI0028640141|nr:hypothetical protein [Mesorhizobium sp. BE184]MDR7032392.1 hypothetical protein [Mesorhizobium sp. BE184]